jgi:hypothetical protein
LLIAAILLARNGCRLFQLALDCVAAGKQLGDVRVPELDLDRILADMSALASAIRNLPARDH